MMGMAEVAIQMQKVGVHHCDMHSGNLKNMAITPLTKTNESTTVSWKTTYDFVYMNFPPKASDMALIDFSYLLMDAEAPERWTKRCPCATVVSVTGGVRPDDSVEARSRLVDLCTSMSKSETYVNGGYTAASQIAHLVENDASLSCFAMTQAADAMEGNRITREKEYCLDDSNFADMRDPAIESPCSRPGQEAFWQTVKEMAYEDVRARPHKRRKETKGRRR
mmetsp:Transcript_35651/g.88693  ORF Transcript_35651/g.88693 Transcript_35651/m.88693 type:complete len:222 (-) Transcript_35651:1195-1860(-)